MTDTATPTGPDAGATFYRGTRADLQVGDLLAAGWTRNCGTEKPLSWIYFCAALDGFAAAPFPLRFDRIENRKAVTLRTREPLAEARAFQKALVDHLLREKAPIMDGTTPEPHIPKNVRRQLSRRPAECPENPADRLDGQRDHPD